MDHRQHDKIDAAAAAGLKAGWTRPEVDRLIAGAAETGAAGDIDAGDTQS